MCVGAIIYLEATGVAPGTEFLLQSEDLTSAGSKPPFKVSFWYHCYGIHVAKLELKEWDGENISTDAIWTADPESNVGK